MLVQRGVGGGLPLWLVIPLLLFLTFALARDARALIPKTFHGYASGQYTRAQVPWQSSEEALCAEVATYLNSDLSSYYTYQFTGTVTPSKTCLLNVYIRSTGQYYSENANLNVLPALICPAGSHAAGSGNECDCDRGYAESGGACVASTPSSSQSCKVPAGTKVGNPILPATGEKFRSETDWRDGGPGALTFVRTYRSGWGLYSLRSTAGMGKAWAHNHSTSLNVMVYYPVGAAAAVTITTPEGHLRAFSKATGSSNWLAAKDALHEPS